MFSKNDTLNYFFDKILSIAVDYWWEKALSKGGEELVAKKLYSGFMGALTFYAEVANGVINTINTLWAIDSTNDAITKKEIDVYISDFIKDYVYKYNMNIDKMAQDAKLVSCLTDNEQCKKIPEGYRSNFDLLPTDFFQVFAAYAVKNNLLKNVNLNYPNNMYYMFEAAHKALWLIENFGDGGNNKVVFNIDEDGNVYISPKSYTLKQLYWMPTKEINQEIYKCMPPWFQNSLKINSLVEGACNIRKYNPFYDRKYSERLIPELFNRYNDSKNISIVFKKTDIDKKSIKNIYNTDYFKYNVTKVINYNGYLNNSGQVYKKIANTFTVVLPKVDFTNNNDNITKMLDKYIKKGIIYYQPNIGEKLFAPMNAQDLQAIFKRFGNLNKTYFKNITYLNQKFDSFMWTTPVKQKQFFEFLVKLLKIDTITMKNFYTVQVPYINDCQNTTLEGCVLKKKGIYHDVDPNKNLTLFNVLIALDNIEKYYIGAKK